MKISLSPVGYSALMALLLSPTACSNSQPATAPSSSQIAQHNQEDVTFITGMATHHQQALDMAELVPERSQNDDVKAIASKIHDEQAPEIEQFHRFEQEFGVHPSSASMDMPEMSGHEGHDMGGMDEMDGMVPEKDVEALKSLSGTKFDKKWLGLMSKHHDGAVKMAKEEVSKGQNPEVKQVAQKIIDAQTAEISDLGALLDKISADN